METSIFDKLVRLIIAIWNLVKNNMLEDEDREMIDKFMGFIG